MCLLVCMSVGLPVCLFVGLSVCYVYVSVGLVCTSVGLSVCFFVCYLMSICRCIVLHFCRYICLLINLFVCLSVLLPFHRPFHRSTQNLLYKKSSQFTIAQSSSLSKTRLENFIKTQNVITHLRASIISFYFALMESVGKNRGESSPAKLLLSPYTHIFFAPFSIFTLMKAQMRST
jgi:hypothetical protein